MPPPIPDVPAISNRSASFPISAGLALAVSTAVVLLSAGCRPADVADDGADQSSEMPTISADTFTVQLQSWPTIVRSQGSLHPDEHAVVGAKIGGRVDLVHVEIGDFVQQDDPLATLDQQETLLRIVQAEAQLLQARSTVGLLEGQSADDLDPKNAPPVREAKAIWDEGVAAFERAKTLNRRNAMSAAEFEQAAAAERVSEAQYVSSLNSVAERLASIAVRRAELAIAKQQLADSVVRAPFTGYIQQRDIAPGTYVATGQPIAVMVRTSPLRFRGAVPERHAQALRLGQEVRLTIQSVETPSIATITRISPMLDPRSRTLMFEAEVGNDDHQLRSGLFAEAEVVIDPAAQAIVLPESAVVEFAGNQKVWKVIEGVAAEQTIVTSDRRDGFRRVDDGLVVGDQVFVDGSQGMVAKVSVPGPQAVVAANESATGDSKHLGDGAGKTDAAEVSDSSVPANSRPQDDPNTRESS
ncbi:Efflux pump periplasmic linker BepF [Rubripirellula lacrimiformis]|uniref:Efflux pump periplasmic linker BepF n=1 Tax=Rubripirellula lacrimiformis TaxID=1930273 RepID=A0A517NAH3_9BACT|nr:efflux RND transporter periplasmic adaptor subunit [Rubripirellula lacrimiformis]QDT04131.1 Efflux pump periplasmic linker BepF [Rubripirellula lacrimiformis]